ncbi:haloacid dehalogenase type II [Scytonema sp. UIC 10036]|uniref:haloacid dehalogenase type II n=1 Tax=Scytonema sp. UIC 10036 TaxID=2304196 RepID=UPI00140FADAC|nr:haloacid dehalogenase type II [Scytonema sp. UIC 10036]
MKTTALVTFDIIGTCFSLAKPKQRLAEIDAPAHTLELWFTQSLRDAFALSHAGSYCPLKEVLEAELPRTLKMLGVQADGVQISQIVASFAELDLQPDAIESFQMLKEAGCSIIALTNGSEDSTRKLLKRADAIEYFDSIFSCDTVQKTKPHPDVYALVKQDNKSDIWMVAVHAWDIAGAKNAGLKTAFITQQEKEYLSVYPQPDAIADSLVAAARKIIETFA